MKSKSIIVILSLFYLCVSAQDHDYIWLGGYSRGTGPPFSDYRIDFNGNSPQITEEPLLISYHGTISVISDKNGTLLFSTNGKRVASHNHQIMENGENLSPDDYASEIGERFIIPPQGTVILPFPGHKNKYYLTYAPFQLYYDPLDLIGYALEYSVIDMDMNNGLGKVIVKNQTVVADSLWTLKLTAVQHANGRDWWMLTRRWQNNNYYKILLSPKGIEVVDTVAVGTPVAEGLGQAIFSPDGSKYAVVNAAGPTNIQIFDFDRCTGELSNEIILHFEHWIGSPGIAISPNSRFLYFSATDTLYQYDLWSTDIESSEIIVGIRDSFVDPFPTTFFLPQLAPDGKIYISTSNGTKSLHVINKPNEKGLACDFRQHAIDILCYNGSGLPNNPNYRLGPLDGSPCDTLGIDNIPVAKFRYEQDSTDYRKVTFTDLSYYEPAEWQWDFDDNTTSRDTNPVHIFPADGSYEVCLTVSNQNGEGTFCRTLHIGTTSLNEEIGNDESPITVFPNPATGLLKIKPSQKFNIPGTFCLYDYLGREALCKQIDSNEIIHSIQIDNLTAGLYFWSYIVEGKSVQSGKVVIL